MTLTTSMTDARYRRHAPIRQQCTLRPMVSSLQMKRDGTRFLAAASPLTMGMGGHRCMLIYKTHRTTTRVVEFWSGQGSVTRSQQIGKIGGTGSGGGGSDNTHLHFAVKHNGRAADPSGREPNRKCSQTRGQMTRTELLPYAMWMYSIRTTQALDPSSGGQLASPTDEVHATVPSGFYFEPLIFNLSN